MLQDIHPTKSARSDSFIKGSEPNFIRCKQCGFPIDRNIQSKGDGWGYNTIFKKISGTNVKDPIVGGEGCPFCGSSEYE